MIFIYTIRSDYIFRYEGEIQLNYDNESNILEVIAKTEWSITYDWFYYEDIKLIEGRK